MPLRPYQQRTIDQVFDWFHENDTGNPIVSASVGAGKSHMIAALCQIAITNWPGTKIVMTVSSRELCGQNLEKLIDVWPEAPASICSASLGSRDVYGQVVYSTIASIYKRAHELGSVSLLLIDECQNVSDDGMYQQFIADLKKYNPNLRVIGWTGTAWRGNGVWLTHQKKRMFHGIAANVTMRELLDEGYLTPLANAPTTTHIDTAAVAVSKGDFKVTDLEAVSNVQAVIEAAVRETIDLTADRRCVLVYCVTIDHANNTAREFARQGQSVAVVTSKTPKGERDHLIGEYRRGRIKYLVNVAVLTTGFDVPQVDAIVLLRATKSPVLYVQIGGRGMRLHPGKEDCLWLDFTNTTAELGPIDQVRGREPSKRSGGDAVEKQCLKCMQFSAGGAKFCRHCGLEFPESISPPHMDTVSGAAVMSAPGGLERFEISSISYQAHHKAGMPVSMRVSYFCGPHRVANEFVCFEHPGRAGRMADTWWSRRSQQPNPGTATAALTQIRDLLEPAAVYAIKKGKYREIIRMEW